MTARSREIAVKRGTVQGPACGPMSQHGPGSDLLFVPSETRAVEKHHEIHQPRPSSIRLASWECSNRRAIAGIKYTADGAFMNGMNSKLRKN